MSESKRALERNKKIFKTAKAGWLAKLVSLGISLLIVPLSVHYLGAEQYGLWVAVSSIVAMLGFLDGGAGNSVINMVSHASGLHNYKEINEIVSTAFFMLLGVTILGVLVLLAIIQMVDWRELLGVSMTLDEREIRIIVAIVGVFFYLKMLVGLVGKVQRGLQEGYLDQYCIAFGALLSLLFIYIAISIDAGLIGFVIAAVSGPIVSYLINSFFYYSRNKILPHLSYVRRGLAVKIFSIGGLFFILQITSAVQMQADNVLIANMLGAEKVTEYSITMKLFTVSSTLLALVFMPLWPAYREALANGDSIWIKVTFYKSIRLGLLVGIPIFLILVLLGSSIIHLWVGDVIDPEENLIIAMGVWMLILIVGNAVAVLLNALQLIKVQVWIAGSAAILNIIVSIILIRNIGVVGAIYGTILSYIICALVPFYFIVPKELNKI